MNSKLSKIIAVYFIIIICGYCVSCNVGSVIFIHKRTVSEKNQIARFSFGQSMIRHLIEIDGYYRCDDSAFYPWYASRNLLFYDDGSYSFFDWKYIEQDGSRIYSQKRMMETDDSISRLDSIDLTKHIDPFDTDFNRSVTCGGAYVIEGNRIITEHPVVYNDRWIICRNYFRVADRKTLVREVFQLVSDKEIIQFDTTAVFRFKPAYNPPPASLQFAKKRKWMWKDKKQWKENKKKRKEDWRNSPYYTKFHL